MSKNVKSKYAILATLVEAAVAAGATKAGEEFKYLVAAANGFELGLAEIKRRVQAALDGNDTVEIQVATAEAAPARAAKTPKKAGPKRVSSKPAPKAEVQVDDATKFDAQLTLLQGMAKGPKAYKSARRAAAKKLGYDSSGNWGHVIGGLAARTTGRFRGDFVHRSLRGVGKREQAARLAILSKSYSKLEGKEVTPQQLQTEAKPHTRG